MVAIARTRLALIESDVDQALRRLVILLSWWIAGLFAAGLGLVVGLAGIFLAVAPENRLAVIGGTSVVLLLIGAAAIAVALKRARRAPRWFAATRDELDKDHAILRSLSP